MGIVPDYNLRAINKYNAKFDRVAVNLPKGAKEKIKELTGKSCNAYISALVLADLERLEKSAPTTESAANNNSTEQNAAANTPVNSCECEQKENKGTDNEIQAGEQNRVNGANSDRDLYEFFKNMTEDELMDAFFTNKGNHEGKTSDEIGKARQICLLHELAKARGVLPDHLK